MSNIKKQLEIQQRRTEAAQAVIDYFDTSEDYTGHLETMLSAQTQIIGLMQMAERQLQADRDSELFCKSDDIFYFLHYANDHLQLLRPFLELKKGGEA